MPQFEIIASGLLCILTASVAWAQNEMPNRPGLSDRPRSVLQESVIPFWTAEPGWRTELQLRNNELNRKLMVTPVVRRADGVEIPLHSVSLRPAEDYAIDLSDALASIAPPLLERTDSYGSIALRYSAPNWHFLYAAAMVERIGHPIAYHIDASHNDPTQTSGSHDGIWWLPHPGVTGYLVIVNQGVDILNTILTLFDSQGRSFTQAIQLGSRAVRRVNLPETLARSGLSGKFGAFQIYSRAGAGALDATEFLYDESTGVSVLMKVFDRDPRVLLRHRDYAGTGRWTSRAPMLALSNPDPALGLPQGIRLVPQVFLHNATPMPMHVDISFNWRAKNKVGRALGPACDLAPYETRLVDIVSLQVQGVIPLNANWASVGVTTSGMPDDLIAAAASFDEAGRYGTQTPFNDQLTMDWKGGRWVVDASHNSIITAGNGGLKPTRVRFTLNYDRGTKSYEVEKLLQPEEQMWLNLAQLVHDAVPDRNGNVIPIDVSHGSYEIEDLTNTTIGSVFEGKVITDSTYGHVAYGCAGCCGYTTPTMGSNPLIEEFGSTTGQNVDSSVCGRQVNVTGSTYGWYSHDTNVATVNKNLIYGVNKGLTAAGSFVTLAQASNKSPCPTNDYNPQGNVDVCDFDITPVSFTSKDCTNGTQQSQGFATAFVPTSSCIHRYKGTGSCSASAHGNVDLVVGTPTCHISSLVPPSATVSYFSGPKRSDGTAGDIQMNFTVDFVQRSVSHSDDATVACP